MPDIPRRDFLKGMAGAGVALAAGSLFRSPFNDAFAADFPIEVGGEDARVGHMLRDGHRFTIPAPSRTVDVVVVGAGVSGLVAAYQLKDANVLVLDKEDRAGGHARAGHWRDVTYSEGAAYIEDLSGYVGALIRELKIPLVPVRGTADALHLRGQTIGDFLEEGAARLPLGRTARQGFAQLGRDLAAIEEPPPLPVENATATQLASDRVPFSKFLKPYGPDVKRAMDLFTRSALGGPSEQVSTYWGLGFIGGEPATKYTAPGGNAAYALAIANALGPDRFALGATVIRVKPVGSQVQVTYVQGDAVVTVAASQVIMACAKHIVRRAVPDLPADQAAAMAELRYEPYMVCNVLVADRVAREAYDIWTPDAPMSDVVMADWVNPRSSRAHTVLTAYCPQDPNDRWRLLTPDHPRAVARRVVATLDRMHPGLVGKVEAVRVFRWGHPLLLSSVGAITRLRPKVIRPFGAIHFAAGDNQMCGALEAAVWEGRKAGLAAKKAIAKTSVSPRASAGP